MLKHGFIFAVLAALFYGIAPIFAKFGISKVNPLIALSIRTGVIVATLLIILVVSGNIKAFQHINARTFLLLGAEGVAAGLLGHFFYLKAIKVWEVSKVTPISASYPLIAFILAIIFLGEKLTLIKSAGAILVISGIVLLGL